MKLSNVKDPFMLIGLFILFFLAGLILGFGLFGQGPLISNKSYFKFPDPPQTKIQEQVKLAKKRALNLDKRMDV